jgi:hemin uptake protein HemP
MSEREKDTEGKAERTTDQQKARIVRAEELFQGEQEIWIEHGDIRYRLRITRRNKLILQK